MDNENILKDAYNSFIKHTTYSCQIATEIEFYLSGESTASDADCLGLILVACKTGNIAIHGISEESGERQYEVALAPCDDPLEAAKTLITLKDIISNTAENLHLKAIFEPKPYPDQPGCGMHIHISVHDNDENLFTKRGEEEETDILKHSVGGLLELMAESMIYFAPTEKCYQRYTAEFNQDIDEEEPLQAYNNAPINISWGGNNRTTAIRVPVSTLLPENRHIEHRVASVLADPYLAIAAVIIGTMHGIINKIKPIEKIHGNAFDDQYDLSLLPCDLKQAEKSYKDGKIIKQFL